MLTSVGRKINPFLLLRVVTDPQGDASDPVSRQTLPLGQTHRHRILSHFRGQPPGHLCAQHPGHLWHHRYVRTDVNEVRSEVLVPNRELNFLCLILQEPRLPPASSSSSHLSFTSGSFPRSTSRFCPDPRSRYEPFLNGHVKKETVKKTF